jgi:Tfp pilus assembly protein PilO
MPKSSKLNALKSKIAAVNIPKPAARDPRATARIVLGILIAANAAAALLVYRPWADSPEEHQQQLIAARQKAIQTRARIEQLKVLVKKSEQAVKEGDSFMSTYFLGRRTAASTLVSELSTMAKASGITPKEHSFAFDAVEGSDTLAMMTITGNYEGNYGDLIQYINRIDRSPRFFIIESLAATPQQGGKGILNINMKINIFVRDDSMLPPPAPVAENRSPATPVAPVADRSDSPASSPATKAGKQAAISPVPARSQAHSNTPVPVPAPSMPNAAAPKIGVPPPSAAAAAAARILGMPATGRGVDPSAPASPSPQVLGAPPAPGAPSAASPNPSEEPKTPTEQPLLAPGTARPNDD